VRRIERWLATARVFLAVALLVAVWMDPSEIRRSLWAYGLLVFYIAQGVGVMLLLRRRQRSTESFRFVVHAADVLWPVLLWPFAASQAGFFLFFVFVMAAAAYRWGLWETVGTALAAISLLWTESFLFSLGLTQWLDARLAVHHWPLLHADLTALEPKRLFMISIYLVVMGLLLGYLAEQQKQLRAEKSVVARILGRARVEIGLTGTLQEIVGELLGMYAARAALVASQESNSYRVFVAEVRAPHNGSSGFQWLDTAACDRDVFLFDCPAETGFATRNAQGSEKAFHVTAIDREGDRVLVDISKFLSRMATQRAFRSLIWVSFSLGKEWSGRIFLLDPGLTGDIGEELHFLQDMVRQVGPAVYNVYLLRRLRLRAGAVERARFARELHDGAVQSLIAVEMQVDVLRRQAATQSQPISDELSRIQGLLREEVLKLRELMHQMKSLDVDSNKLLPFLNDAVDRFQRETGITARFVADLEQLEMPSPMCRELARIVQEALVNVRKHSGAKHVLVRMSANDSEWMISIEDDGRGFPFEGKLSQEQMDAAGKGPLVIKERVRLVEGELTIESTPGHGARLEIRIPQKRQAVYG
jgi:signal transduction histidine kinase